MELLVLKPRIPILQFLVPKKGEWLVLGMQKPVVKISRISYYLRGKGQFALHYVYELLPPQFTIDRWRKDHKRRHGLAYLERIRNMLLLQVSQRKTVVGDNR